MDSTTLELFGKGARRMDNRGLEEMELSYSVWAKSMLLHCGEALGLRTSHTADEVDAALGFATELVDYLRRLLIVEREREERAELATIGRNIARSMEGMKR